MRRPPALSALAPLALSLIIFLQLGYIASAQTNTLVLKNSAGVEITEVLLSPTGQEWFALDIGDAIPADSVSEAVFQLPEGETPCVQLLKAVFADGSESEEKEVDLCEEGLELEFE